MANTTQERLPLRINHAEADVLRAALDHYRRHVVLTTSEDRELRTTLRGIDRRLDGVLDKFAAVGVEPQLVADCAGPRHADPLCGCKIDADSHSCGPGRCRKCGR